MAESRTRGFVIAGVSLAAVLLGVVGIAELWADQTALPDQTDRDPNGYLANSDGDLFALPGEPETEMIDAIPDPEWVGCYKQPSWWGAYWDCKVCSPGYYTGQHCFVVSSLSAACGSTISVQEETSTTGSLTVGAQCGAGQVEVGLSRTVSVGHGASCTAGPCQRQYITVCYPDSQRRIWVCSRRVPDKWRCQNGRWVVTKWRTEYYETVEFIPGSQTIYTCTPEDASCLCKSLGHPCDCPPIEQDQNNEEPEHILLDGPKSNSVSFDISQLTGGTPWSAGVYSVTDLDAQQLYVLKNIILHMQSNAENADATSMLLVFSDMHTLGGSLDLLYEYIDLHYESRITDISSLDLNQDGTVDAKDYYLLKNAVAESQEGVWYPSAFDLNGDGVICDADLQHFRLLLELEPLAR